MFFFSLFIGIYADCWYGKNGPLEVTVAFCIQKPQFKLRVRYFYSFSVNRIKCSGVQSPRNKLIKGEMADVPINVTNVSEAEKWSLHNMNMFAAAQQQLPTHHLQQPLPSRPQPTDTSFNFLEMS